MGAFFVVASVIMWLMQVTIGAWLFTSFPQIGWKYPVVLLPVLFSVLMFGGLGYTRTHWGVWESWLYYFAYTWMGLVFLGFCICAGFAVLHWILNLCHLHCRVWLGVLSVATMGVVFGMAIYGGISSPKLKRISVTVPGAPKMKLALLSDSHLGMGVSYKRFDRAMSRIEAEKPDALLVLGDVFE